jgi:hypothetical protein
MHSDIEESEHTLQDINKKYKQWHEECAKGTPMLGQQELANRLEEFLGKPQGLRRVWKRVIVFDSDLEVEEFDKEVTGTVASTVCAIPVSP